MPWSNAFRLVFRVVIAAGGALPSGIAHAQVATPLPIAESPHRPPCVAGVGVSAAPRSIEAVVALINSLPRPVTVPCLVEALAPPLNVFAMRSTTSLMVTMRPEDARYFIFFLPLIISVTSDGPGAELVELSEVQPGNQLSLKGELRFPIEQPVPVSLPFSRIANGNGTTCAHFCHQHEARDVRIKYADAFLSKAIRPSSFHEVTFAFLEGVRKDCRSPRESVRCGLLDAIFGNGRAVRTEFPEGMPVGF